MLHSSGHNWELHQGGCLDALRGLPDASVHCCVTSPPYWGLRDYGTDPQVWGGAPDCAHDWQDASYVRRTSDGGGNERQQLVNIGSLDRDKPVRNTVCARCGAWRGELGLEPTPDLYVEHLVLVFREVRRVLRHDGTLWLNLGDSYAGSWGNYSPNTAVPSEGWSGTRFKRTAYDDRTWRPANSLPQKDLKAKDLVGIPWRVALALRQSHIIPNCVADERDRAWLAAMFDGEGCIGIRRFDSYRKEKQQVYQDGFVVYTVVTNNDIALLDRCVVLTSFGRVALKQSAGSTDGRGIVSRRDSYGWRLDGNKAVEVVCAIYPYLIAKRKQACIAYTLDRLNKNGHGSRSVPSDIQAKKHYLWMLMKRCNQREAVDLPDWIGEPKQIVIPGWYLRSDIVWAKENCMPESVRDRPTRAHEYVFLLAKSERYFYDADAVSEPMKVSSMTRVQTGWNGNSQRDYKGGGPQNHLGRYMGGEYARSQTHRNRRTVWSIATKPYKGAHFAVFPPKLVEPCILAGTSADGCCPRCGAPRRRIVAVKRGAPDNAGRTHSLPEHWRGKAPAPERGWETARATLGWEPACSCSDASAVPCVVLDPSAGSGTAGAVAIEHGRRFIGIELNASYCELAAARLRDAESKTTQRELPARAKGSD